MIKIVTYKSDRRIWIIDLEKKKMWLAAPLLDNYLVFHDQLFDKYAKNLDTGQIPLVIYD